MEEKVTFTTSIDKCGRFVIPTKVLKTLSWDKGILAFGEVNEDYIIIKSLGEQVKCNKCNKKYNSQYNYCPICGEVLKINK